MSNVNLLLSYSTSLEPEGNFQVVGDRTYQDTDKVAESLSFSLQSLIRYTYQQHIVFKHPPGIHFRVHPDINRRADLPSIFFHDPVIIY